MVAKSLPQWQARSRLSLWLHQIKQWSGACPAHCWIPIKTNPSGDWDCCLFVLDREFFKDRALVKNLSKKWGDFYSSSFVWVPIISLIFSKKTRLSFSVLPLRKAYQGDLGDLVESCNSYDPLMKGIVFLGEYTPRIPNRVVLCCCPNMRSKS